jgi:rfaE bifunctional protein kinase chain/domain
MEAAVNPAELLAEIAKLQVLVVGDVCLDRWCRYDPALAEPSRETGIPRTAVVATEVTPGAAGTVANNVSALGARVSVLGAIGDDGFGFELIRALETRGIEAGALIRSSKIATFTYTKLLNSATGDEDLPRVDYVNTAPLPEAIDREIAWLLEQTAAGCDVILVSDQAETSTGGVITARVRETLTRIAAAQPETVVWVDSRMRPELFRGVIVKPNQEEAAAASQRALGCVHYPDFRSHIDAPYLIVTHGGNGALLVDAREARWIATRRVVNPVDICGAGDSFSAGAAMALRVTRDPEQAVRFGNLVASITIMKKGTGTASPAEVCAAAQLS